ncbi:hypothetical protein PanWU01x14_069150 [Parasponia andersonii]|uniref:Uncharacterized protein n=1 Tax=Parasponia andersonii TaxID=3476 RepID=A0A2P5DFL6_PARAD|nr:hypothetical protein PanWU01x14_069150 [Parasponia andersonii]
MSLVTSVYRTNAVNDTPLDFHHKSLVQVQEILDSIEKCQVSSIADYWNIFSDVSFFRFFLLEILGSFL